MEQCLRLSAHHQEQALTLQRARARVLSSSACSLTGSEHPVWRACELLMESRETLIVYETIRNKVLNGSFYTFLYYGFLLLRLATTYDVKRIKTSVTRQNKFQNDVTTQNLAVM